MEVSGQLHDSSALLFGEKNSDTHWI
jgi:hypothetical protein